MLGFLNLDSLETLLLDTFFKNLSLLCAFDHLHM